LSWHVDTNVISELVRPRPDPGVVRWVKTQDRLQLSAIVVEEIEFGLAWKPKARIRAWWSDFLARHCVVLPVDAAVARRAGHLRGQLRAAGMSRTQADMLVAATAAERGATLVTRNVEDFAGCGIAVHDPFERASG
jgi:predicted nucleic acid-binding protein